eukprot:3919509-Rhodomonas_salina.1
MNLVNTADIAQRTAPHERADPTWFSASQCPSRLAAALKLRRKHLACLNSVVSSRHPQNIHRLDICFQTPSSSKQAGESAGPGRTRCRSA